MGEGNYSEKIERMVSRGNLSPYAQRGKEKCNIWGRDRLSGNVTDDKRQFREIPVHFACVLSDDKSYSFIIGDG